MMDMKEYYRRYYQLHKEKIKAHGREIITCPVCGIQVKRYGLTNHKRSKKCSKKCRGITKKSNEKSNEKLVARPESKDEPVNMDPFDGFE